MSLPPALLVAATHPFSLNPLRYGEAEAAEIGFVSTKLQGLPHGRLLEITRNLQKPLQDRDFSRTAAFLVSILCIDRHQVELAIHMGHELKENFQCYIITREHVGKKALMLAHFFHLHLKESGQGFDIGVPNWTTRDVSYIKSP